MEILLFFLLILTKGEFFPKEHLTYYDTLRKNCITQYQSVPMGEEIITCCKDSVENMELNHWQEAKNKQCEEGMTPNMFRCMGSYRWCEPKTAALK